MKTYRNIIVAFTMIVIAIALGIGRIADRADHMNISTQDVQK